MSTSRSWLGSAAAAGPLVYVALIVVLHFLRTDYEPAGRYLSEYSVGRFGFLGNAAVYVLAATLLLVSAGLRFTVRASLGLTLSCALLALASAAFFTIAAFPPDVQPMGGGRPTPTRSGAIHHQAALVALLSLIPGLLVLPIALWRDPQWRTFSRTAFLLGLLFLASVVAFVRLPWSQGWAERAGAVTLSSILFLTALRVRECTSLSAGGPHASG
jgi:hypothetical protein